MTSGMRLDHSVNVLHTLKMSKCIKKFFNYTLSEKWTPLFRHYAVSSILAVHSMNVTKNKFKRIQSILSPFVFVLFFVYLGIHFYVRWANATVSLVCGCVCLNSLKCDKRHKIFSYVNGMCSSSQYFHLANLLELVHYFILDKSTHGYDILALQRSCWSDIRYSNN